MIKDKIKELRANTDLTQSELAKEIGLPQSCISFWEKGTREPSIDGLRRLADFFDVTTDYLLGLETIELQQLIPQPQAPRLAEDEKQLIDAYRTFTAGKKKALFDMLEIEPAAKNKNNKQSS